MNKRSQFLIFSAIIIIGAFWSVMVYNQYNSAYSSHYKTIGEKIEQTAEKDEVAFMKFDDAGIKQIDIIPQYIIYAQRNVALWQDNNQADELIKLNKLTKGVVFTIDNNYKISDISRIDYEKLEK